MSLPRIARMSFRFPASWATDISFQSRYPGKILIPKIGSVPSIGMFRCGGQVAGYAGQRYNCNRKQNIPSHAIPPSQQNRVSRELPLPSGGCRPGGGSSDTPKTINCKSVCYVHVRAIRTIVNQRGSAARAPLSSLPGLRFHSSETSHSQHYRRPGTFIEPLESKSGSHRVCSSTSARKEHLISWVRDEHPSLTLRKRRPQ